MAKLASSAICRRVIIDQATNLVSMIDLLEAISLPQEPIGEEGKTAGFRVQANLVTVWVRSTLDVPEEVDVEILIRGPKKQKLANSTQRINLQQFETFRAVSEIAVLPYVGVGRYEVSISAPGYKAVIPFKVDINPAPGVGLAVPPP